MRLNRKTGKERLYRQGAVFVQRLNKEKAAWGMKNRHLHNAKREVCNNDMEEKWEEKNNKMRHLYLVEYHICSNQSIQPSVSKINCQDCCLALCLSPGVTHDHAVWKAQKGIWKKKNQNVLCCYHRPRRYERGLNHNYLDSFWLHESSTLENTMQCLGKHKKELNSTLKGLNCFVWQPC